MQASDGSGSLCYTSLLFAGRSWSRPFDSWAFPPNPSPPLSRHSPSALHRPSLEIKRKRFSLILPHLFLFFS